MTRKVSPFLFAPLALTLALTGCSGVTESMSMPALFGGSGPEKVAETPEQFRAKPTCPMVEIRSGTEAMTVYEPGKTDQGEFVRFQANVQRVARDCDLSGEQVSVRVGVAGRVTGGPKAVAGTVQVPVRVVVMGPDGKPVYSRAQLVPVALAAPDFSGLWTLVDDQVRIPSGISAESGIYVGIDEQALKGGALKPEAKKKKS